MNEQTQLLLKDAEYLTCPEAELIPDGVRLTALINLVRKLAEAVPTAYTAGQQDPRSKIVQRARQEGFTAGLESVDALIAEFGYDPKECLKIISEFLSEKVYLTRLKASSAIKEEINKSKV